MGALTAVAVAGTVIEAAAVVAGEKLAADDGTGDAVAWMFADTNRHFRCHH